MAQKGRPRHPDVLTPREQEVLDFVRAGLTNPQIGERLDISVETVKQHVSQVLSKLGVSTREEAAAWRAQEKRSTWWVLRIAVAALSAGVLAMIVLLVWGWARSGSGDESSPIPLSEASATLSESLAEMAQLESYEAHLSMSGDGPGVIATLRYVTPADYSMSVQFSSPGGASTYEQIVVNDSVYVRECAENCGDWQIGSLRSPILLYSLPTSSLPKIEAYPLTALAETSVSKARQEADGSLYIEGTVNHLSAYYKHEVTQYEAAGVDLGNSCDPDRGFPQPGTTCHEITYQEAFEEQIAPLTTETLYRIPPSQISAWLSTDHRLQRALLKIPILSEGNLLSGRIVDVAYSHFDDTEISAP